MSRKISLFSLVMLIVASIDSIRNLPTAALFGSSLLFFFILAAIMFLLPTAFIAAELTSTFPEKGGVYYWVYRAFGEKTALLAIWMQWINTMVWYPTILSFIAGTAAYLIHPELAQNKLYLIGFIIGIFWTLTFLNFKGMRFSSHINSFCGIIGTVIPMSLVIILGALWLFSGQPLQMTLSPDTLLPSFTNTTSWISLIAIMASFLGMELAGVHVTDIKNPQKNFPKAVLIASFFILITMLFGSLAIAMVIPSTEINLLSGIMQVFQQFFTTFHLSFFSPILSIMIVIGLMGSLINWLISPAKGLLHAAEFGYLTPFFTRKNSHGVPTRILVVQATLVTLLCFVFLLVPSINGFYWFLTALSTGLYMIMYVLMFLSALRLHHTHKTRLPAFKIPGNTLGMWITALVGILGCLLTITVSFLPPYNIEVGSSLRYISMIACAKIGRASCRERV